MPATIHQWPARPVVSLVSEFASSEMQWHGGDSQTFKGGIQNVLKLQVEFKYKKPYGGDAKYRVAIDRQDGEVWTPVIIDEVRFDLEPTDDAWHPAKKEYELSIGASLFWPVDRVLGFRITAQIEGPGHMDTGGGSGSLGSWGAAQSRQYKATFEKPQLHLVQARVKQLQAALQEGLEHYRKTA